MRSGKLCRRRKVCSIGERILKHPCILARVTDRVTGKAVTRNVVVVGAIRNGNGVESWQFLRNWEVVQHLNSIVTHGIADLEASPKATEDDCVTQGINEALRFLESQIASLELPFEIPEELEVLTVLWPAANQEAGKDLPTDHVEEV